MKFAGKTLVLLLLIGTLLAACAPTVAGEPTVDINASLTAGVGTVIANFFETQTALAPPASETPSITPLPLQTSSPVTLPTLASVASATPYIVYLSPTPTGTYYTATPNPSSLAYGCNNLGFIRDETIPSGTVLKPGESFTKEWKVANTGTCPWKWAYRVVNVSGNAMGGSPAHPNQTIDVGKWATLRVTMTAPNTPGTYTGYWQMSDDAGHKFGSILGVSIVVTAPTSTPKPATATNTATSTSTSTTAPPTQPPTLPPTTEPTLPPTTEPTLPPTAPPTTAPG
jgi:hypothetical protein